jgi:hypothetical protein
MYYLLLGVIAVILSCHLVYCGLLNLNHWYILVSMVLCPTIEFLGGLLCPILGPLQVFQIVEELPSESWNPDVPSTLPLGFALMGKSQELGKRS